MDIAKIWSPVIWPRSLLLTSAPLCEVFLKAVPVKQDNMPNSIWSQFGTVSANMDPICGILNTHSAPVGGQSHGCAVGTMF